MTATRTGTTDSGILSVNDVARESDIPRAYAIDDSTKQYAYELIEGCAHRAAILLEEVGWIPSSKVRPSNGRLTMVPALVRSSHWPADFYIVREVLRDRNLAEDWCKAPGRQQDEVVGVLRDFSITEPDVERLLGPTWLSMMMAYVLRDALSEAEQDRMDSLRSDDWEPVCTRARELLKTTGRRHSLSDLRGDAQSTWCAARGAAWAVGIRDLLDPSDYEVLITPWKTVIGPLILNPDTPVDIPDKAKELRLRAVRRGIHERGAMEILF